jgi:phosphoglycerate dehydrogenase-like enzyme
MQIRSWCLVPRGAHLQNPRLRAALQAGPIADTFAAAAPPEASPYLAKHTVCICSTGGASSPSEP